MNEAPEKTQAERVAKIKADLAKRRADVYEQYLLMLEKDRSASAGELLGDLQKIDQHLAILK